MGQALVISKVPAEIIGMIVPDRSDLVSLLRVSKKFHSLVEPIFLQIIELEVVNRRHPSLIPFYEFITSASHGQRRSRSVKSFSIVFLNPAEEAAPQDLNIIDEIVPKFKSLRSLQITLSVYTGAMPLRLLRNPSPWFSLQRFSYSQRSLNHINLDIFLNTQKYSITHVELWTRGMSLPHIPNLFSLSVDPQALRQVVARNASVSHLWTMLSGMEGDLSTLPALDNLVTLSCSVSCVPSLSHLLSHAQNLKHLQITVSFFRPVSSPADLSQQVRDLELLLEGIRDANITHARFLLDSVEKGTYVLQKLNSDFFHKSLRCIEVQGSPPRGRRRRPHSSRASRMYRGQSLPVTVQWLRPVEDIWFSSDWENDVRVID